MENGNWSSLEIRMPVRWLSGFLDHHWLSSRIFHMSAYLTGDAEALALCSMTRGKLKRGLQRSVFSSRWALFQPIGNPLVRAACLSSSIGEIGRMRRASESTYQSARGMIWRFVDRGNVREISYLSLCLHFTAWLHGTAIALHLLLTCRPTRSELVAGAHERRKRCVKRSFFDEHQQTLIDLFLRANGLSFVILKGLEYREEN